MGWVGRRPRPRVITRLAKLRSLFVIAQGTVFTLHERSIRCGRGGPNFQCRLCRQRIVRRQKSRITITVELAEVRTARIVWREAFDHKLERRLARAR